MRFRFPCIILFRFCKIDDLFSLLLPNACIYVIIFFKSEIRSSKLLVLVLFFGFLLCKLLIKIREPN